jgi:hypothetical protein
VHLAQLTLSPIQNHKTKYENVFFKKWLWHPSYAKLYIILSKSDNVIENIQIHHAMTSLLFFLVCNFAQLWKKKYEKKDLPTFFFEKKNH